MPKDIIQLVFNKNKNLAKEAKQIKHERIVKVVGEMIKKKYEEIKGECLPIESQNNPQNKLRGFPAYLWLTNKKDVLKRMLINGYFQSQMNVQLNSIDQKNQILNNLFITLQNTEEFPSDNQMIISA